jgi:PII-like signaling protein
MIPENARLLRLLVKGNDCQGRRAHYRLVVERARAMGMAGASVFRTEVAMAAGGVIYDQQNEYTADDVPLEIEIVDSPARIDAFLEEVGPSLGDITTTIEPVRVLHYAPHSEPISNETSGERP